MTSVNIPAPVRVPGAGAPGLAQDTGKDCCMTNGYSHCQMEKQNGLWPLRTRHK